MNSHLIAVTFPSHNSAVWKEVRLFENTASYSKAITVKGVYFGTTVLTLKSVLIPSFGSLTY